MMWLKLYKRILRDWPHLLTMWASVEIVLKFADQPTPDFQGFVVAICGITAAMTGKHYWDTKSDNNERKPEVKDEN